MKVKVLRLSEKEYLVAVPRKYCNSANSIDQVARAVNAPEGSSFHIMLRGFMREAQTVEVK